jgi:hypothetical protein
MILEIESPTVAGTVGTPKGSKRVLLQTPH